MRLQMSFGDVTIKGRALQAILETIYRFSSLFVKGNHLSLIISQRGRGHMSLVDKGGQDISLMPVFCATPGWSFQ